MLCLPAHPERNGQVERKNAEILRGLKTRSNNELKTHGAGWIDELPAVLWANQTAPSRARRETTFFLVYGAEVVLPPELTYGSPRVELYGRTPDNENLLQENIIYLEEHRRREAPRAAQYQQNQKHYFQRKVRTRVLQVGGMVLRRVLTRAGKNKLSPQTPQAPQAPVGRPHPGCWRPASWFTQVSYRGWDPAA